MCHPLNMKILGGRRFGLLLAAVVACSAPTVVSAEPSGLANFGLSSATPVKQSPEQRLLDIRIKTYTVAGYTLDEGAHAYAESLVERALAGDLNFIENERSVADDHQERDGRRAGRVFRIPRSAIEAWISREEQHYRDAVLSGGKGTPTERVGLATGADAASFYYVEVVTR